MPEARDAFHRLAESLCEETLSFCRELVRTDSRNPPGDTRAIAALCAEKLAGNGIDTEVLTGREPIANLVARVRGAGLGRRLAFNGHLDTGTVPEPEAWTVDPFGGTLSDGRLYGRGVSDMKAGVAAMTMTLVALGRMREAFRGEAILALVGDEGSGGRWGTHYVLDQVPEATGDALLSADVGSTSVARFGEKGYQWIELKARGRSAGGAHPHLGRNAAELVIEAVRRVQAVCAAYPATIPRDVRFRILEASARSEALAGEGETAAMLAVTANLGVLDAGTRPNLVPAEARAVLDLRFPPGVGRRALLEACTAALGGLDGVDLFALDGSDPSWSSPDDDLIVTLRRCAGEVLGTVPALSLRLGFSDTRIYRERGVPAVVLGATPQNGNAADEWVEEQEIRRLFLCHATTAFDYLRRGERRGARA
jgi:acetylornithine deacetylase/succinyl-diaminopimelate desuccinylase-like protein